MVDELRDEIERLKRESELRGKMVVEWQDSWRAIKGRAEKAERAYYETETEVQQILGEALGYPIMGPEVGGDGERVCVGPHVAATLASEAARRIADLKRRIEELEQLEKGWTDEMYRARSAWRERDEADQRANVAESRLEKYRGYVLEHKQALHAVLFELFGDRDFDTVEDMVRATRELKEGRQ